jgi:hypothetical protein
MLCLKLILHQVSSLKNLDLIRLAEPTPFFRKAISSIFIYFSFLFLLFFKNCQGEFSYIPFKEECGLILLYVLMNLRFEEAASSIVS